MFLLNFSIRVILPLSKQAEMKVHIKHWVSFDRRMFVILDIQFILVLCLYGYMCWKSRFSKYVM